MREFLSGKIVVVDREQEDELRERYKKYLENILRSQRTKCIYII